MRRPHLLLITTDQQRGDCLGINGHPVLSTPNLDFLGRSGANFPHAYAETPSCVPARRTIISGMKPVNHGMVGYKDGVAWELEHSLPGELGKAGYQTELVGKLHLWPHRKRYGFDHLTWADSPRGPNDYTEWLRDNGATAIEPGLAHGIASNGWVGRPSHLPEEMEHTNWCVNEAMRFLLRRDETAPFFLWVSFFAPHPPLAPPQIYYDRYMALNLPEPVIGDWAPRFDQPMKGLDVNASRIHLDKETMKRCRAAYYGCINHVDDQAGRLFAFMQKLGVLRDTFIVMTSDHGEMLGDHNMFRKTFAYEASARVPFLIRAPHWMACETGRHPEQVVGLMDVMPTLLDAAGVSIPDTVDGDSLLPLMRGESISRQYLHGEHTACYHPDDGVQYLTDGKEKLIWYTKTGVEQFFDLQTNPNEERNLIDEPHVRERVALWRERLIRELANRPEGYSDGKQLIVGQKASTVIQPGTEG